MLEQRIDRAKELLSIIRHIALGTVNPTGEPHVSPVFGAHDEDLNIYWASNMQAQHSQNIARDPRVSIVLFDSTGKGGGLYISAKAQVLSGAELQKGLIVFNNARKKFGRAAAKEEFYINPNQRLYQAKTKRFWVNITETDELSGEIVREYLTEVKRRDLIRPNSQNSN